MGNMRKISALCCALLLSTSIFAKAPTREDAWTLDQQKPVDFIEMDMFDQQILTVRVAPKLSDGKAASAIAMHCHGRDFKIQPGEKAVCVINWSFEIATITIPHDDIHAKSAGTYTLTYIS